MEHWTRPNYNEFQEIIKRLDALDKKLGLPDCVDPAKTAFMKQIENRLDELEKKIK